MVFAALCLYDLYAFSIAEFPQHFPYVLLYLPIYHLQPTILI